MATRSPRSSNRPGGCSCPCSARPSIEFKVGAKKFERLDYEQAWDFRIDLKNFHAPSPDLGVP
jgi:hypothetical protein